MVSGIPCKIIQEKKAPDLHREPNVKNKQKNRKQHTHLGCPSWLQAKG